MKEQVWLVPRGALSWKIACYCTSLTAASLEAAGYGALELTIKEHTVDLPISLFNGFATESLDCGKVEAQRLASGGCRVFFTPYVSPGEALYQTA